ncbi:hypothetical protein ACFLZN_00250 [Nanoarchaeota archaeon]
MAEKDFIVNAEVLSFDGIFKIKEVMKAFKKWFEDKGYGLGEISHTEALTPDGKRIEIKYKSSKKVADYAKKAIEVGVIFENIKDKIVEKHGKKSKYNIGKVSFEIDAALITDYELRWKEDKPAFYLIRMFFEKHIYSPYGSKVKDEIRKDVDNFKSEMGSFLNLYKY